MSAKPTGRPSGDTEPTEDEIRLLTLLSKGLTDDAAATRLELNPRTLRRRLTIVMQKLGARSRFQAGFLVCRRGWLRHPHGDEDFDSPV